MFRSAACLFFALAFAGPLRIQAKDEDGLPSATLPEVGAGPALIICVNEYDPESVFANLPGIDKDMQQVEKLVGELGFSKGRTQTLYNPSKAELESALQAFVGKAGSTEEASFLYFSGHGVQSGGENYVIPSNAPIKNRGDLSAHAIDLGDTLDKLEGAKSGPVLVFVDACRDNNLAKASGIPKGVKGAGGVTGPVSFAERSGLFIGFAASKGGTSTATSAGSVFTTALAVRLLTGGRSLDDVYAGVIGDVRTKTRGTEFPQSPEKRSALGFVFYLVPKKMPAPPPPPPPPPPASPWMFPDSDQRYLTTAELKYLSQDQLWVARNEIFARHGLIFTSARGQAFALSLGKAYHGAVSSQATLWNEHLNDYEKENALKILALENARKSP